MGCWNLIMRVRTMISPDSRRVSLRFDRNLLGLVMIHVYLNISSPSSSSTSASISMYYNVSILIYVYVSFFCQ